jgi:hypothetical protein
MVKLFSCTSYRVYLYAGHEVSWSYSFKKGMATGLSKGRRGAQKRGIDAARSRKRAGIDTRRWGYSVACSTFTEHDERVSRSAGGILV